MEIDVRPCRTGEMVVMHDETLARVTNGADRRSLATISRDDLRAVRLAGGERVPLLDEVLSFCAACDVRLNVEVKRDVPARISATLATADVLRRHHAGDEVIVSSFDPFMLAGMAVMAPRVAIALLLEPEHLYLAPFARGLRASAINPAKALVNARFVRRAHRRGLRVVPWTVNDVEDARRLLSLGVDGIITDDPGKLAPLFA